MQLTLKVRTYNNAPAANDQRKTFSQFPVVIGRSSACHYRLDDESRYISSRHATIALTDGQLYIEDTSSNGVFINDSPEPVGRGKTAMLQGEEILTIGDYQLLASFEVQPASDQTPLLNPFDDDFPKASSAARSNADPFNGGDHDWTPPSEKFGDPFEDVWAESSAKPASGLPPTPAPAPAPAPSKGISDWPDDWDESKVRQAADQPGNSPAQSLEGSSDWPGDEFDWASEPPAASDAITRHNNAQTIQPDTYQSNTGNEAQSQVDPFAVPDWESINPASSPQPAPPQKPPMQAAQNSSGSAARQQSVAGNGSLRQLLVAAGLNPEQLNVQDEAASMAQSGRVLSQSVDAMMLLLRSRTEMKNAIRSDVTMLSKSNNNPLKFSLTAADALTRLLAVENEGFMNAEEAINEAVADLKLHQIAMLDGMKAAVKSLLRQFDPEQLAKKMEKKGGIGTNIPITRQAKLWELFCEQYDTISEEAVTDFDDIFGIEFRKAYEARIRQLGRDPEF